MIYLVNKSKLITDSDVKLMVRACAYQLRYHASPAWRLNPTPVAYAQHESDVPPGAWVLGVMDDPDQADALGWHSEDKGVFYGRVFVRPVLENGGDALTAPLSVATVASHEVLEIFVDPSCNRYAETEDPSTEIAVEVCDPVESSYYTVQIDSRKITVSNFVFENWFDAQTRRGTKLDYLGECKSPFQMAPGGYVVVKRDGQVSQEFSDKYPAWRKEIKKLQLARTARRIPSIADRSV